jgi:hypothetical protein
VCITCSDASCYCGGPNQPCCSGGFCGGSDVCSLGVCR